MYVIMTILFHLPAQHISLMLRIKKFLISPSNKKRKILRENGRIKASICILISTLMILVEYEFYLCMAVCMCYT